MGKDIPRERVERSVEISRMTTQVPSVSAIPDRMSASDEYILAFDLQKAKETESHVQHWFPLVSGSGFSDETTFQTLGPTDEQPRPARNEVSPRRTRSRKAVIRKGGTGGGEQGGEGRDLALQDLEVILEAVREAPPRAKKREWAAFSQTAGAEKENNGNNERKNTKNPKLERALTRNDLANDARDVFKLKLKNSSRMSKEKLRDAIISRIWTMSLSQLAAACDVKGLKPGRRKPRADDYARTLSELYAEQHPNE